MEMAAVGQRVRVVLEGEEAGHFRGMDDLALLVEQVHRERQYVYDPAAHVVEHVGDA